MGYVYYKHVTDFGSADLQIGDNSFVPVVFTNTNLKTASSSRTVSNGTDTIDFGEQNSKNGPGLKSYFFDKLFLGGTAQYEPGWITDSNGNYTSYRAEHVICSFFQSTDFKRSTAPSWSQDIMQSLSTDMTNTIKTQWIPRMLKYAYNKNPEIFDKLYAIPSCRVNIVPEYADLITANQARGSFGNSWFSYHLVVSFIITYCSIKCDYVLSKGRRQRAGMTVNYNAPLKNSQEVIYINLPGGESDDDAEVILLPDLTDDVYENTTGLIKLPDYCEDLWDRTNNLRTHVTHWDANGQIVNYNENYVKYVDPNCYAYSQYVWKKDHQFWYKNYTASAIEERQCLWVSGAWFTEDEIYASDPGSGYHATWYPYTILPNGQGHNPDNGFTLGFDVTPYWSQHPNGDSRVGFAGVDSATQSALCFTNLLNFTENNGKQKQIYAYTEGDDFEQTIVKGVTPSINLSIKGQNISRFNLETNNMLTRW